MSRHEDQAHDAAPQDANVLQDTPLADAVLVTPRLVMRPLVRGYVEDLVDLYADPAVTRFLVPLDEAGHLQRCWEAEQMWASRGYGRVALHDKASGRFVGRSGLHHWAHLCEVEVTWALRRDAWGQGYATEAAAAWLTWASERGLPYVTAMIDPQNTASRAVAERLGMAVVRTDVQHDREVLVYAWERQGRVSAENRSAHRSGLISNPGTPEEAMPT